MAISELFIGVGLGNENAQASKHHIVSSGIGLNQRYLNQLLIKSNFILVITDDQGHGPIGRHGHPWIRTPNLDKLYDTSTRFDRFLVSPLAPLPGRNRDEPTPSQKWCNAHDT